MSKCKCSMTTALLGDGCEACNPEMAAQLSHTVELLERDHEARVAKLVEALQACYEMSCENKWASTARISVVSRAALDEWRKP